MSKKKWEPKESRDVPGDKLAMDEATVTGGAAAATDAPPAEIEFCYDPNVRVSADVLIAIPTCATDKHLEDAIRATWGKEERSNHGEHFVDIVFFDGKTMGVPDGYDSLPIKVQAICGWALSQLYSWMFKCDTDTFVWIDRLMASGFEQHDYSGWTSEWKMPAETNYCSGGAGYWLSKKAMKIVAEAALTKDTAEDRWVGRVLFDAGIKLHRNPNHAHGRHDEVATNSELLTMHPCSSIHWMRKMQDA